MIRLRPIPGCARRHPRGGRRSAAREVRDGAAELGGNDRLRQVPREASAPSRGRDPRCARAPRTRPPATSPWAPRTPARNSIAVPARHADVADRDVGPMAHDVSSPCAISPADTTMAPRSPRKRDASARVSASSSITRTVMPASEAGRPVPAASATTAPGRRIERRLRFRQHDGEGRAAARRLRSPPPTLPPCSVVSCLTSASPMPSPPLAASPSSPPGGTGRRRTAGIRARCPCPCRRPRCGRSRRRANRDVDRSRPRR